MAPQRNFDPGFTVPAEPKSQSKRNVLLVAGIVLVAALLAGAVYKAREHPDRVDPGRFSTAQASTDGANGSSAVATAPAAAASSSAAETSTAVADAAPAPAVPPPPAKAQKAKSQLEPPDYGTSNSAAEIQAQQQAAQEQRRVLDAMEKEVDQLDGRAASVESGVDTLEQEMHRDGLGLRGDMVAARNNMRTDIAKAKQAMDSGDTERARHYLDLAHREVEKLEAFLGHR